MLLSACGTEKTENSGDDEPGSSAATDDAPFVVTPDGEVEVSCGGAESWAPSVMAEGPVGDGAYYLRLKREGDHWQADGWGDCQLSPVLKEGHAWAEVIGYRGGPEGTTITAVVRERECASGREPERFLHEPFVVETAGSVTLYWTSQPPSGAQTCQGNPTIDRVVELSEPLGTRPVFDGFSYPPREVRMR